MTVLLVNLGHDTLELLLGHWLILIGKVGGQNFVEQKAAECCLADFAAVIDADRMLHRQCVVVASHNSFGDVADITRLEITKTLAVVR